MNDEFLQVSILNICSFRLSICLLSWDVPVKGSSCSRSKRRFLSSDKLAFSSWSCRTLSTTNCSSTSFHKWVGKWEFYKLLKWKQSKLYQTINTNTSIWQLIPFANKSKLLKWQCNISEPLVKSGLLWKECLTQCHTVPRLYTYLTLSFTFVDIYFYLKLYWASIKLIRDG